MVGGYNGFKDLVHEIPVIQYRKMTGDYNNIFYGHFIEFVIQYRKMTGDYNCD